MNVMQVNTKVMNFNWPVVSFLLLVMAIPGIPAMGILVLVLLGPEAVEGVSNLINGVYFKTPGAILVHAGAGVLFFLFMPFQFSPRLRQHNPRWHRVAGAISLVSGMILGLSGIWMYRVLNPGEMGADYYSLTVMSVSMALSFLLAFVFVVRANIPQHKKWMIRAVAISLGAITPLFVNGILALSLGWAQELLAVITQFQADYGRLSAMAINLMIAEWVIRRKQLPQAQFAAAN